MVSDTSLTGWSFLVWALPHAGLRTTRYRRVRRQVLRRVKARARELGLSGLQEYGKVLEGDPCERQAFRYLARVTVSRFFRDARVFTALGSKVLPHMVATGLITEKQGFQAWSAGCASGEEAHSVAFVARNSLGTGMPFEILGTDVDPDLCQRARRGVYRRSTLREVPREIRSRLFDIAGDTARLRADCRDNVSFTCSDLLLDPPPGLFHVILCRNLLFTYFDAHNQHRGLSALAQALRPGGALIIGRGERLPRDSAPFSPWPGAPLTFRYQP